MLKYYPHLNSLSFFPLNSDERATKILWQLFLVKRKLLADTEAQKPPMALFIEPFSNCNLACKYCYAQSSDNSGVVDAAAVGCLLAKYPSIDDVLIFGGDIFTNADLFRQLVPLLKNKRLTISTNGILIKPEQIRLIQAYKIKFSLQISLEPEQWDQRVDHAGIHQNKLLNKIDHRVDYRVTIPQNGQEISLQNFIADVKKIKGDDNFSIHYWHEASDKCNNNIGTYCEESKVLLSKNFAYYQDKVIFTAVKGFIMGAMQHNGFNYFNCNAAYGAVSIGPDNKIYGCHERAVIKNSEHALDPDNRLPLVQKYVESVNAKPCADCELRYLCGSICFVDNKISGVCEMMRQVFSQVLPLLPKYMNRNLYNWVAMGNDIRKNLYKLDFDQLEKEL